MGNYLGPYIKCSTEIYCHLESQDTYNLHMYHRPYHRTSNMAHRLSEQGESQEQSAHETLSKDSEHEHCNACMNSVFSRFPSSPYPKPSWSRSRPSAPVPSTINSHIGTISFMVMMTVVKTTANIVKHLMPRTTANRDHHWHSTIVIIMTAIFIMMVSSVRITNSISSTNGLHLQEAGESESKLKL